MTELDTEHLQFLKTELAKPGFAHTFVFMHDIIWWEPDSTQWWREVHPLLKNAKVDAVFTGDLGPLKFSTTTRDSVRYFQSSFETKPSVEMLRGLASSRLLSSQFDNFLEVRAPQRGNERLDGVNPPDIGDRTPGRLGNLRVLRQRR